MVIATVVIDVTPYVFFRFVHFKIEQIGGLVENPLTMAPCMIVAGRFVGAPFTQGQLKGPIYGFGTLETVQPAPVCKRFI